MIEINLLPEELRRQEGTPLPRRLAIYAGAALLASLGSLVAIQRLNTLPGLRNEKQDLGKRFTEADGRVQREVKPLQDSLDALDRKRQILASIRAGLLRWGPRLDSVHKALVNDLDGVWLTGLLYEEKDAKARDRTLPPGTLDRWFTLFLASSDFSDSPNVLTMTNEERISDVVRRLSRDPDFTTDVIGISGASWAVTEDFRKPPWNVRALTFPVITLLRSPPPPPKAPPAAKPATGKKG